MLQWSNHSKKQGNKKSGGRQNSSKIGEGQGSSAMLLYNNYYTLIIIIIIIIIIIHMPQCDWMQDLLLQPLKQAVLEKAAMVYNADGTYNFSTI